MGHDPTLNRHTRVTLTGDRGDLSKKWPIQPTDPSPVDPLPAPLVSVSSLPAPRLRIQLPLSWAMSWIGLSKV